MSEIITIRIEKSLKQKIRKYKINISKTSRAALEIEIKKNEDAEFAHALDETKRILEKIPQKEIVKAIRESRDQR